jgi:O-antigen/teichoic acid export membrane protein
MAAYFLGQKGFGEYIIAKGAIAFLQLPLFLGQGIAIPRYIALTTGSTEDTISQQTDIYFISGLFIVITAVSIFFLLINLLFSNMFAYIFFGNSKYSYFTLPIAIAIVGLCLHLLIYSYYRGRLMMFPAQSLQVINMGIIPLLVFVIPNITPSMIFLAIGIGQITTCVLMLFLILSKINFKKFNVRDLKYQFKELLKYGSARVPGEFALVGLFTLPVTFTTHVSGVVKAGFVGIGMSFLSLIGSLFAPVGLILLPSTTRLIAENKLSSLKQEMIKLLKISISLTILIVLFLEIFAVPIIRFYLGKEFIEASSTIRYIILGALPYVIYVIIRNVIDAFYVKPFNTLNLTIALAIFGLTFLLNPYKTVQVPLLIALFALGLLTMFSLKNIIIKKIVVDEK